MSVDLTKWSRGLEYVGERDAVHAAVIIGISKQKLKAGDSVRFIDKHCLDIEKCNPDIRHGIVSPFLESDAPAETAVPVLLKPDSTSNLRHHYDVSFAGKEETEDGDNDAMKQEIKDLREALREAKDRRDAEDEYDNCRGCY